MADARFSFGPFVLDRGRAALQRDGAPVALGQRGIALLDALLEAEGGVVAKGVLMERAWPGTIVEEGNLTVQMAALRKALGTRPDGLEWIATVPRMGYRLVLPLSTSSPASTPEGWPLLAVVPFQNLGGDPEQEYFADGVVEDIITALSRFKSFAVVARNSSFVYKGRAVDARQVSKELGVRYLLEGSVRRAGARLRITAQLVDGHSGAHLWAHSYDGAVEDVFEVQDRIVESVASVIEPEILRAEIERSRRERPGSIAAYDLYLRGLQQLNTEGVAENAVALAHFTEALALEPDNGTVLIHAAWALAVANAMGWPGAKAVAAAKAPELAQRAVAAAPNDGEVLARGAVILAHSSREYDVAEPLIRRGLEVNPNAFWVVHCAGIWKLHCGSLEEAIGHFHRGLRLSPNDPSTSNSATGLAHAFLVQGKYEEALQWAEQSLGLNRKWNATYWMLIAANAHLGRLDAAHRHLETFRKLAPETTIASIRLGQPDKIPGRIEPILDGLRLAGLPET